MFEGRLLHRYKRFLADVQLSDGRIVTAHTANTGAMLGCSEPGSRVWLSKSPNPKRKYSYTWELVEAVSERGCTLVGINTLLANRLVAEAIEENRVAQLRGYASIQKEVRYGMEKSRIDLLLTTDSDSTVAPCYVEVKNVTLAKNGVAYFPDAKSARALKHLRELMQMKSQGARAVIFFCVPREDVTQVKAAGFIDPDYAQGLKNALQHGVQALAYRANVTTQKISLQDSLPVVVD